MRNALLLLPLLAAHVWALNWAYLSDASLYMGACMCAMLCAVLFYGGHRLFAVVVLAHAIPNALYLPFARIWGLVSVSGVAATMGTTPSEARGLLASIPAMYYVQAAGCVLLALILVYVASKIERFRSRRGWGHAFGVFVVAVVACVAVWSTLQHQASGNMRHALLLFSYMLLVWNAGYVWTVFAAAASVALALRKVSLGADGVYRWYVRSVMLICQTLCGVLLLGVALFAFQSNAGSVLADGYVAWKKYRAMLSRPDDATRPAYALASPYTPKYKNYVLIIGESQRADYMSVYGYPLDTTPFLKTAKGIFATNYYALAPSTDLSLVNTFYDRGNASRNFMDIAKLAGMKVFHLSNNNWDNTKVPDVFADASFVYRTHPMQSFDSDIMRKAISLAEQSQDDVDERANLFVLHLFGQHWPFCKMLEGRELVGALPGELGCYAQSILDTDRRLAELVEALDAIGSWALMYFADHGLASDRGPSGEVFVTHCPRRGKHYQQCYRVPMFKMSSDDVHHEEIGARRSALDFARAFAEFIGAKVTAFDDGRCFWCDKESGEAAFVLDSDFNEIPVEELLDDPPVRYTASSPPPSE